jgi:hypothetical protein
MEQKKRRGCPLLIIALSLICGGELKKETKENKEKYDQDNDTADPAH